MLYDFPQPTPMIMVLGTHFTRASDVIVPDFLTTDPVGPDHALSRPVRQLVQPHGRARRPHAPCRRWRRSRQRPARSGVRFGGSACGRGSAGGHAGLSARQPLLRDRPAFGNRLAIVREDAAGLGAGPGDLRFRPPSHRFRIRARPRHQDGVGSLSRKARASAATMPILPLRSAAA